MSVFRVSGSALFRAIGHGNITVACCSHEFEKKEKRKRNPFEVVALPRPSGGLEQLPRADSKQTREGTDTSRAVVRMDVRCLGS